MAREMDSEKTLVHATIRNIAQLSTRMNQLNLFSQTQGTIEPSTEEAAKPIPAITGHTRPHEFHYRQLQGLRVGTEQLEGAAGKLIGEIYRESQTMQEAQLLAAREKMEKLAESEETLPEASLEEFLSDEPQEEKPPEKKPQHEYAYNPVIDTRL